MHRRRQRASEVEAPDFCRMVQRHLQAGQGQVKLIFPVLFFDESSAIYVCDERHVLYFVVLSTFLIYF